MARRILIVRFDGVGTGTDQAAFTTTSDTLAYLPVQVAGVVVAPSSLPSSMVQMFASQGSDAGFGFSILSTAETREYLLSRVAEPVRDADQLAVRLASYMGPERPVTVDVSGDISSSVFVDDVLYIGLDCFLVRSVPSSTSLELSNARGSKARPISMQNLGGLPIGPLLTGRTNGLEGTRVTVSRVDADATSAADEEVVFRGVVSSVVNDTSAGADNFLRIDCASIIGVLKSTPYVPPKVGGLTPTGAPAGPKLVIGTQRAGATWAYATWIRYALPPLYNPALSTLDTFAWSVVTDDKGVVTRTLPSDASAIPADEWAYPVSYDGTDYTPISRAGDLFFDSWRFASATFVDPVNIASTDVAPSAYLAFSSDFAFGVVWDLLVGTVDRGTALRRAAGQSAYLPADWVDYDSIRGLDTYLTSALPNLVPLGGSSPRFLLPTMAPGKSILEVLVDMLSSIGACLVVDQGVLRVFRWGESIANPTDISDANAGAPSQSLGMDRNAVLQSLVVESPGPTASSAMEVATNTETFVNPDLSTSGVGQRGVWRSYTHSGYGAIGDDATAATVRYSRSPAIVAVTLLDSSLTLQVGQFITHTTDLLPGPTGTMGYDNALGIVTMAGRSWDAPATRYTLMLFGYIDAGARPALWAATGQVEGYDNVTFEVTIKGNAFTREAGPFGAPERDIFAFEQTLTTIADSGGDILVSFVDTSGTDTGATPVQVDAVSVGSNVIKLAANPSPEPTAGDFVIIAPATVQASGPLALMRDAFQADASNLVDGDVGLAWQR